MEEDKKKKKNKKKKNKQNAVRIHDTSPDGLVQGDSIPTGKNHTTSTTQVDFMSTTDLHQDAHLNRPEDTQVVTREDKILLDKDLSLQKEVTQAGLLEKLEELQKEKAVLIQQEASLHEQISQLEKERDAYVKKEARLEKEIAELHTETECYGQKEILLEVKIGQLQREKESWSQKEALFEEKINHLMGQSGTLSLEKASLEQKVAQMEKERDSWMLQENLTKEVIASLNGENSALKSQVVELEELRSSLLQENHHLKETISDLQSQILNLEKTPVSSSSSTEIKIHPTENGDLAPQAEAADALVENLIGENAALVEKVNEPYIELHYKRTRQEESLNGNFGGVEGSSEVVGGLQPNGGDAEMHGTSSAYNVMRDEASEKMEGLDLRMQALTKDGSNEYLGAKNTVLFQDSSEMIESDEIVQIPLDENEAEATDVEGSHDGEEEEEVPLVDAPLIGAPFRLISFVARYVSGADLVEKSSLKPGAT